jgi:hypothetical protein
MSAAINKRFLSNLPPDLDTLESFRFETLGPLTISITLFFHDHTQFVTTRTHSNTPEEVQRGLFEIHKSLHSLIPLSCVDFDLDFSLEFITVTTAHGKFKLPRDKMV